MPRHTVFRANVLITDSVNRAGFSRDCGMTRKRMNGWPYFRKGETGMDDAGSYYGLGTGYFFQPMSATGLNGLQKPTCIGLPKGSLLMVPTKG